MQIAGATGVHERPGGALVMDAASGERTQPRPDAQSKESMQPCPAPAGVPQRPPEHVSAPLQSDHDVQFAPALPSVLHVPGNEALQPPAPQAQWAPASQSESS